MNYPYYRDKNSFFFGCLVEIALNSWNSSVISSFSLAVEKRKIQCIKDRRSDVQWNLDITKSQGTDKMYIRYIEVIFHVFYYKCGNENRSL